MGIPIPASAFTARGVSPSPHPFPRGNRAFSSTSTSRPAWARRKAADEPAGPAPTTMTSAVSAGRSRVPGAEACQVMSGSYPLPRPSPEAGKVIAGRPASLYRRGLEQDAQLRHRGRGRTVIAAVDPDPARGGLIQAGDHAGLDDEVQPGDRQLLPVPLTQVLYLDHRVFPASVTPVTPARRPR